MISLVGWRFKCKRVFSLSRNSSPQSFIVSKIKTPFF